MSEFEDEPITMLAALEKGPKLPEMPAFFATDWGTARAERAHADTSVQGARQATQGSDPFGLGAGHYTYIRSLQGSSLQRRTIFRGMHQKRGNV